MSAFWHFAECTGIALIQVLSLTVLWTKFCVFLGRNIGPESSISGSKVHAQGPAIPNCPKEQTFIKFYHMYYLEEFQRETGQLTCFVRCQWTVHCMLGHNDDKIASNG